MSADRSDEDYWINSKPCHYNFDEDDEEGACDLFLSPKDYGSVFNSQVEESNTLPIHSLISKKCLTIFLDDVNTLSQNVIPPAEETVRRLGNGQKFILCMYRSLKDKLLLLDYALTTWDGYIILCVINYLRTTLKPYLFHYHLTKKKVAIKQYAYYLTVNNKLQDLEDLYMATGNMSSLDEIVYLLCKDVANKQTMYNIIHNASQNISSSKKKKEVNQYKQLLQWQMQKNKSADSVIEQMAKLIREEVERNDPHFEEEILRYKKLFNISDYQYEWTLLNTMCYLEVWPKLVDMFIKPNWFTKKSGLKTVIEHSLLVTTINKHNPPRHVIEELLKCMSDQKEAYNLAERLKCHKFLINYYIINKDRLSLISYKNQVPSQSEEYFMIENAIHSNEKRWKN